MTSPATSSPRESWRGCLAIVASLLGLLACLGLAFGLPFFNRFPTPLDRYFPLKPGAASLYRVTYADGSQGYLSVNIAPPNSDALTYAALLSPGGQAIQIHSIYTNYTNWQGQGQTGARDDFYSRHGSELFGVGQTVDGETTLFNQPVRLWTPEALSASSAAPVNGQTEINGQALSYQLWSEGEEQVTLPNGRAATAVKIKFDLRREAGPFFSSLNWYVPEVGVVRSEEFDSAGRLILHTELLTSSQLQSSPASLPLDDVLAESSSTTSFFRENAARTGAHPEARLPDAPLKIAYRLTVDSAFTASPTYADGLLYVADQAGWLTALDARQGTVRWQFAAGGPIVAAPAVAEGWVYLGASDKTLYALEARNGLYVWSFHLRDNVATSPVVADGILFVGGEDRTLYALDARTGAERWRYVTGDRIVSSPAIAEGRVFFGGGDSLVYALEAATGKLLWKAALDAPVEAAPSVVDGVVYAGSTGAQLGAFEAATGKNLWIAESRFGYRASPAVGAQSVFVADEHGEVRALDRASGKVMWEWRSRYGAAFTSSPLLLADKLLVVDQAGALHVFDAATGKVLQQLELGDSVSASPTWEDETVFITTQGRRLIALQAGENVLSLTFTPAWQQQYTDDFNSTLRAPPFVYADDLYFVTYGGDLWRADPVSGEGEPVAQFGDLVEGALVIEGRMLYLGTQRGRVIAFDLETLEVAWRQTVEGQIRFGPLVVDQQVYVHARSNSGGWAYALDAATGELIWDHATRGVSDATPIVVDGKVIVPDNGLVALDPQSGDEIWRSAPFVTSGGLAAYDGMIFVAGSGAQNETLLALDAATGKVIWRSHENAKLFFNRPGFDPETRTLLIGAQNGQLYAFDADTGDVRWRFLADAALQTDVQIQNGIVYFTSFDGTTYAVEVRTGRLLANFKPGTGINTYTGPLVVKNRVYVSNGLALHALEIED